MGHLMTTEEKTKYGIPTPPVKISSGWETYYYYLDDNSIPWSLDGYRRDDGWTEWRARPSAIASTAEKATKLYAIAVGRFPVSAISSTSEDDAEDNRGIIEIMGTQIDDYVRKRKGGGWFIALLLFLAAASKRR